MINQIYLLPVLTAVLASFGQLFFKLSAKQGSTKLINKLFQWQFITGGLFFFFSASSSIIALKYIPFSIFYSFSALNYLFIGFLSHLILKEKFDIQKITGLFIIVIGIIIYNYK